MTATHDSILSLKLHNRNIFWPQSSSGCLLGAVLGLLRLSWEASGPQKPEKTLGFLRFLQMQVFGYLKLLMALLGSSWPFLGPIWSQNGPQNGPQNYQKVVQKMVEKPTPENMIFKPILGPKMGPKMAPKWAQNRLGVLLGSLGPILGPKLAQEPQDSPKTAPR